MSGIFMDKSVGFPPDVGRPPSLVEGFDSVWLLDSTLTAEHWKYLWQRFGVGELIDIGRRSGWFSTNNDCDAILQLLKLSRASGYDPIMDGFSAETPLKQV